MIRSKSLGNSGEKAAEEYLKKNNYQIIAHNYKSGYQEIDLIAHKNKQLIFIEVKTRIKTKESVLENPISKRQLSNIKKAIIAYCLKTRINLESIRLDLILILVNKNKNSAELKHYRDIL